MLDEVIQIDHRRRRHGPSLTAPRHHRKPMRARPRMLGPISRWRLVTAFLPAPLLAVTDEHVYLLEYRRRTLAPRVGGVVAHLPRRGLVAQWQRRALGAVSAELSWPEEHAFLTGRASPGPQTDQAIGLLMGSELERYA